MWNSFVSRLYPSHVWYPVLNSISFFNHISKSLIKVFKNRLWAYWTTSHANTDCKSLIFLDILILINNVKREKWTFCIDLWRFVFSLAICKFKCCRCRWCCYCKIIVEYHIPFCMWKRQGNSKSYSRIEYLWQVSVERFIKQTLTASNTMRAGDWDPKSAWLLYPVKTVDHCIQTPADLK